MQNLTSIALATAALALSGCGNGGELANRGREGPDNHIVRESPPPPPQFGAEEAMTGTWTASFEHSEFNGCWFDITSEAYAEFQRLDPRVNDPAPTLGRSWRLRIMGRRSVDPGSGAPGYGHMGGWRCEIRATRILSAEIVGGGDSPAPPEADPTPTDPDAERARKAAGAVPPAFSEGHDRARLEEQRRSLPPGAR